MVVVEFDFRGVAHVGLTKTYDTIHDAPSPAAPFLCFRKISPYGLIWPISSRPSRVSSSAAENVLAKAERRRGPTPHSGGTKRASALQLGRCPNMRSMRA